MGKINEYQRKQLASTAVGVAPEDKSGAIVGQAISKGGAAIARREAIVQDQYSTSVANVAVMQFGLGFQKMATSAQREMASNPGGYPSKIYTSGSVMVETFANGIEDPDVRAKFVNAANTILKAGVFQAAEWATAKKKENATTAAGDAISLGAIQAGNTLTEEAFAKSLATVKDLAFEETPDDVLGPNDKEAILRKTLPSTIETHFANRIAHDPQALIDDLDAGVYNKYAEFKGKDGESKIPIFTSAMRDKYRKQAVGKIQANKALMRELERDNYSEATEERMRGNLSFDKIDALVTAKNPEDRISPSQGTTLKNGLINQIMADATKIMVNNPDASRFIKTVHGAFDDKIDRAIVIDQINDVYTDGIITDKEGEFLDQMRARIREVETAKIANRFQRWMQLQQDAADRFWPKSGVKTNEAANAVRDMLTRVREGVPVDKAGQAALHNMETKKVLETTPSVAGAENPVEAAYEQVATDMMNRAGKPITKGSLEALVRTLKANADANRPKLKEE
jgi:hypothetical protein